MHRPAPPDAGTQKCISLRSDGSGVSVQVTTLCRGFQISDDISPELIFSGGRDVDTGTAGDEGGDVVGALARMAKLWRVDAAFASETGSQQPAAPPETATVGRSPSDLLNTLAKHLSLTEDQKSKNTADHHRTTAKGPRSVDLLDTVRTPKTRTSARHQRRQRQENQRPPHWRPTKGLRSGPRRFRILLRASNECVRKSAS
jgi:hypothetical protein